MNELIINGIDHSKFDLEWAKRGGVCTIDKTTEQQYKNDSNLLLKMVEQKDKKAAFFIDLLDKDPLFRMPLLLSGVRMATPSECAEAGIEYIEPPIMWRDIESAPIDRYITVWCDYHKIAESAIFESIKNNFRNCSGLLIINPTHWMPLPQPSKDA